MVALGPPCPGPLLTLAPPPRREEDALAPRSPLGASPLPHPLAPAPAIAAPTAAAVPRSSPRASMLAWMLACSAVMVSGTGPGSWARFMASTAWAHSAGVGLLPRRYRSTNSNLGYRMYHTPPAPLPPSVKPSLGTRGTGGRASSSVPEYRLASTVSCKGGGDVGEVVRV
jgi:hypothetical protein